MKGGVVTMVHTLFRISHGILILFGFLFVFMSVCARFVVVVFYRLFFHILLGIQWFLPWGKIWRNLCFRFCWSCLRMEKIICSPHMHSYCLPQMPPKLCHQQPLTVTTPHPTSISLLPPSPFPYWVLTATTLSLPTPSSSVTNDQLAIVLWWATIIWSW